MSSAAGITLVIPVQSGRLNPSLAQQQAMDTYLQTREGKAVSVKFCRPTNSRSQEQNRYLWGVCYTMLAAETGHSTEELHTALKEILLPRKFITLGNREVEVTKSTADLNTTEFEHYLERLRVWAQTELGIRIPLPNE